MSRNTADIGRALELLREGLGPFVEREVKRLPGNQIEDFIRSTSPRDVRDQLRKTPIREWDVYVLLNLMQWRWLWNRLGRMERLFVGETQDWRNKWAHQQMLTAPDADVDRALDTAVRLLRAVKAETQAAEVARLWESRKAANALVKGTLRSSSGAGPRSSVPAHRPPSRSAPASQADEIRRYAIENYVTPWRESGNETLVIRAGDVEREMALRQATPNVCSALEGRKFQAEANLILVSREGPRRSTTTTYYYRQS